MKAHERINGEQIVALLRQIEVQRIKARPSKRRAVKPGYQTTATADTGKNTAGLDTDQARRQKKLYKENNLLKHLVVDLSLERQIHKDLARETCKPRTTAADHQY
ncbi:MAG: hypothetical protein KGQ79_00900 [Proteobacteria bacterium]|nr:hypothetical protein [Pseudomonadota bacterium]